MKFEVRVPKFGMSAVDAEVTEIFVTAGQAVSVGTPLLEIGADKVDFAIEAEVDGAVAEIFCAVGEKRAMGEVLLTIDQLP